MKVALVGFASTRDLAPYDDKSYEIWALNDLYSTIPRWDRWFDIHDFDLIARHVPKRAKIPKLEAYSKMTCPVYMQDKHPQVPNSVKYPLDKIIEKWGVNYFTNSISYMIALALYEGYKTIDLYGIHMSHETEYAEQKPSVEFWVGMAKGMGVNMFIPEKSSLLKGKMYGFIQK